MLLKKPHRRLISFEKMNVGSPSKQRFRGKTLQSTRNASPPLHRAMCGLTRCTKDASTWLEYCDVILALFAQALNGKFTKANGLKSRTPNDCQPLTRSLPSTLLCITRTVVYTQLRQLAVGLGYPRRSLVRATN